MLFNNKKIFTILFLITIIGLLLKVFNIEWEFNKIVVLLERILSNNTIVFLSHKLFVASSGFLIGFYSYLYLLPRGIIVKINRLSFLELSLILFTIFMGLMFIEILIYDYLAEPNSNFTYFNSLGANNSSPSGDTSTSSPNPHLTIVADGAIITAAMASAHKMAHTVPTVAGKAACVAICIAGGAGAIAAKNIVGNLTSEIGKNHFTINTNLIDILRDMFNLTGNHALDLLNMIQFFQRLQLLIAFLICYNLLLTNINLSKLESLLARFLPSIIIRWYLRSVTLFKKSSYIVIICLLILLLIFNYLSYYYLGFFLSHLDQILELYFKK